jgi:tetratricopeptide (TPR) repeat protein
MADDPLPDFDSLWDFGDPAGTEADFRGLLDEHADAPEAWRLQLQTQIARTLGLQREFDAAHALLDEVEGRLDDTATARVRYLLERGRVFNSAGSPEEAAPLFEQAFDQARRNDDDALAIDAAHMMGIVEDGERALEWNLRALEMAEGTEDDGAARWRGSLYNNIGWTYDDMGDYERALQLFEKGVTFRREQGQGEPLRIARWSVAHATRMLGRPKEALERLRAIERDYPEADDPYMAEEFGECLLALDKPDEARPYFQAAWEGLKDDRWLEDNEPERFERLERLGAGP